MLVAVDKWGRIRVDAQRWALERLQGLSRRLGRSPAVAAHLATGMEGEQAALFYLRRLGYTVVARRWRTAKLRGDLDLVAWQEAALCFIEVKTRTRRDLVPAEFAVDEDKERILKRMAGEYLRHLPRREREAVAVRFDVVSVYLEGSGGAVCEVFPDAFR